MTIFPPSSSISARTASIATRRRRSKRRAYRTVLDIVFHALVRWVSPILCFTTEEVWQTRYPDGGSVHLLEWPEIDPAGATRRWREMGADPGHRASASPRASSRFGARR